MTYRCKVGEGREVVDAVLRYGGAEGDGPRHDPAYHQLVELTFILHLVGIDVLEVPLASFEGRSIDESLISRQVGPPVFDFVEQRRSRFGRRAM